MDLEIEVDACFLRNVSTVWLLSEQKWLSACWNDPEVAAGVCPHQHAHKYQEDWFHSGEVSLHICMWSESLLNYKVK